MESFNSLSILFIFYKFVEKPDKWFYLNKFLFVSLFFKALQKCGILGGFHKYLARISLGVDK